MPCETEYMQNAYKLLYEIETSLKNNVESTLSNIHGIHWEYILKERKDFENTLYHDIVSYYGKYVPLTQTFTDTERKFLYSISNIRNKVAHMKVITNNEYTDLKQAHEIVQSKLVLK